MSEKYLIFGATGSIGSNLSEQLKNSGNDIHLVARNESEVNAIASKLGCSFTVADVLDNNFLGVKMPPIIIASTKPRIGKTAFVASLSKILSTSNNIKINLLKKFFFSIVQLK